MPPSIIWKPPKRGWETVTAQNFSAQAMVDLTSFLNTVVYSNYRLYFDPLTFSASTFLALRFSSDNGASFYAGVGSYGYLYNEATSAPANSVAGGNGTTIQVMSGVAIAGAAYGVRGWLELNGMGSAVIQPHCHASLVYTSNAPNLVHSRVGGSYGSVVAMNAIRLLPGAGTISGTVTIEGQRK